MRLKAALRLGRISNLPTVWTNALAGIVLAGGLSALPVWRLSTVLALAVVAVSLAYVGGMFLNDAFDARIDAERRPERPIPSGEVARRDVFLFGFAMLGVSIALFGAAGLVGGTGPWPAYAGITLAAAIVLYDLWHKGNPLSPLLMGLCRVLVYVAAALCVTTEPPFVLWAGAGLLLSHLIGLTYVAKQETLGRVANLWPLLFLAAPIAFGYPMVALAPAATFFLLALLAAVLIALAFLLRRRQGDIPRAVMTLIAAISLLDAMLIAGIGNVTLAAVAAGGFLLTLALQRFVAGT